MRKNTYYRDDHNISCYHYVQGLYLQYYKKDLINALTNYELILYKYPNQLLKIYFQISQIYFQIKNYKNGIKFINKAQKINPNAKYKHFRQYI